MGSAFWLYLWARVQMHACSVPVCACHQALLFVWPTGRRVRLELRTRDGMAIPGAAPNATIGVRSSSVTLYKLGLARMLVVHAKPVEVPHA